MTGVEITDPPREREGGDVIVVGRNTFKEVIRGIHEGYFLPADYALPSALPPPEESKEGKEAEQPPPPKDPVLPPILPSEYSSLPDPPDSIPEYTFTYVPSLHILGVRHTPRRIYRFLTRRYLADEICSQVVACILEQDRREWSDDDPKHGENEERFWPKTVKPDAEWRDEMVIDQRIRPKLFWRRPSEVQEIPDYREPSAPDRRVVNVNDLQPTDEELSWDQAWRAEAAGTKDAKTPFNVRPPWTR